MLSDLISSLTCAFNYFELLIILSRVTISIHIKHMSIKVREIKDGWSFSISQNILGVVKNI